MILSKQPYRGYHLVPMRNNGTFQVRILDAEQQCCSASIVIAFD